MVRGILRRLMGGCGGARLERAEDNFLLSHPLTRSNRSPRENRFDNYNGQETHHYNDSKVSDPRTQILRGERRLRRTSPGSRWRTRWCRGAPSCPGRWTWAENCYHLIRSHDRSRDDLASGAQADMFSSHAEDQWFSKEKLYKVSNY